MNQASFYHCKLNDIPALLRGFFDKYRILYKYKKVKVLMRISTVFNRVVFVYEKCKRLKDEFICKYNLFL